MSKTKSKNIDNAVQIGLDQTISHGNYYVPPALGEFFVELAQPKRDERILRIGFREPTLDFPNETEFIPQIIPSAMQIAERQKTLDQEKYDVILCAPNFGTISGENKSNEEMWLEWGVKHLKEGGRFVIVVPMGLLSNYSQMHIRQFLVERTGLEAVIELPSGWAIGAAISASILYITTNNRKNRPIKMFQLSRIYELSFVELAKEVRSTKPKSLDIADGKVFTVSGSELDSSRLDVKYYDPAYKVTPPSPEFKSVNLVDLAEIKSGNRFAPDDFSSHGVPFVPVKNLTASGEFDFSDSRVVNQDIAIKNRSYCVPGDVLVSTAGTIGKVALVPQGTEVCIDTSLRRLRIRDKSTILSEYLALFLRSETAIRQMKRMSSGSVINVLSTPNLEKLIVYVPSLEKQFEIVQSHNGIIQEIQKLLLAAFPRFDIEAVVQDALTTSKKMMAPSFEEEETETLHSLITKKFPYPIARPYSVFTNSANDSATDRVKKLIELSEAIVYYVYGILVSDFLRKLDKAKKDAETAKLLLESIADYSIDKRIKHINRNLKAAQSELTEDWFMPELLKVKFDACNEIHNNVRNKYSHNKSPDAWCKKQVSMYSPKLDKLLQDLQPLMNYRLLQIKKLAYREGKIQHHIVTMMGNNSIFISQVEDFDRENQILVDTDHVFILDQNNQALDLHPFYQLHAWENTGMNENLCFLKQTVNRNTKIKIESVDGAGEIETELDVKFSALLTQLEQYSE